MVKFGKYILYLFIMMYSFCCMMKKFDLFFEIDKYIFNFEKKKFNFWRRFVLEMILLICFEIIYCVCFKYFLNESLKFILKVEILKLFVKII